MCITFTTLNGVSLIISGNMMSLRLSMVLPIVLVVLSLSAANAFVVSSTHHSQCRGPSSMIRSSSPLVMQSALDGIKEPIENYVHIW